MTEHLTLLVSLFFVGTLGLSYGRIITVLFESREAALNFGPELTLSPRQAVPSEWSRQPESRPDWD